MKITYFKVVKFSQKIATIFQYSTVASAKHDIVMNTVSHTLFHFAEGVAQRIDPLD